MNEIKTSIILFYLVAVLFDIINAYGASMNGLVNCPANYNGYVPHPLNCTLFLECNNGIMSIYSCNPNTYYNRVSKKCDNPANVPECLPVPQIFTDGHKQLKQSKLMWELPKQDHHHHRNQLQDRWLESTNYREEQSQDGWQEPTNPQDQQDQPQGYHQQPSNHQEQRKQHQAGWQQPSKPKQPWNQPSLENPPLDDDNQLDQLEPVTLPSHHLHQGNERSTVKPQVGWQQPKNPEKSWNGLQAGSWQPNKPQHPWNQPSVRNSPLDNDNQLDQLEPVTLPSHHLHQENERSTVKPQVGWQQPKNPEKSWNGLQAGSWQPNKPQHPWNQPSVKNSPLDNDNQLDQLEPVTLPSHHLHQGNERSTVKPQVGWQQPKNPEKSWNGLQAGSWQPNKPQHPWNQPSVKNPPLDNDNQLDQLEPVTLPSHHLHQGNERSTVQPQVSWQQHKNSQQPWNQPSVKNPPVDNGNQLDQPEPVTLPSHILYHGNERSTVKHHVGWQQTENPQKPWNQPQAGSWQPNKPQHPWNQPSVKNPPLDNDNQSDQPEPVSLPSHNLHRGNERSTVKHHVGWQEPENPRKPWNQPQDGSWQPKHPQQPWNQPNVKHPPLDNDNQFQPKPVTLPSHNLHQDNERSTVKHHVGWQEPENPRKPWNQPQDGSWQPNKPQHPWNQPSVENPPLDNDNQLDQLEPVTLPSHNHHRGNERSTVKPQVDWQQPKHPQQPWNQPSVKHPPLNNGNQLNDPAPVTQPSYNFYQENQRSTVKPLVNDKQNQAGSETKADC